MTHVLKIEKLAYGGEGIGRLAGKVCFVEGALPGEEVEVEILQDKKSFVRGRAVKVLTPSPFRLEAPCAYVATCGGCQYQHLQYMEELRWKEIQVREYLSRNLKISEDKVGPIVECSREYHYRNSVTVHRAGDRSGFYSEDNEKITVIDRCLLADERLQPAFKAAWSGTEEKRTHRLSAEGEVISDESDKIFPVSVGGKMIYTTPKSFFQNNREVTAKIGEVLAEWVNASGPETFVDLYSGVGTFSVLSAGPVKSILCAEDSRHSRPALEMNLEYLGIPSKILDGSVEKLFPSHFRKNPPARPFVFMDPPRAGMLPEVSGFLAAQTSIPAMAYLSCHLGSLTRDLDIILKGGNFEIDQAIPFDMFPRTKHIEILVLLKRKTS